MRILKFESPTCGPCRKMDSILQKLGITVEHINALENVPLCKEYEISTLPTLIKIKDNGKVEKLAGMQTPTKIEYFCTGAYK